MDSDLMIDAARHALWVLAELIAPVVLPVLLAALIIGLLQAATSISEATLSFVPKMVTMLVALALSGAMLLRVLSDFTLELYDRIPLLLR